MKPICVRCRRFFRPKKNGFTFLEGMPNDSGAPPGLAEPESWSPYKLWSGDLWECKSCGAQIISGVAGMPLAENYQPDFDAKVNRAAASNGSALLQVNDC